MSALVYQGCRLTLGILYPAYCSFKAVRSKNVKEYVKWMMYWIVFALYSFVEVFADYILVWFPFYYELKICFILWLVAPATKGSSVLYRKVVHPQLLKREKEIDANISKATDQGYAALITLGSRGFNFATSVVLSTAIKGSSKLSDQLQKSLSLNDLSGDSVDFRPRRRLLQSNVSLDDEEERDNRLIRERYRRETATVTEEEESLDDIDRQVDEVPVLDVQRRRRRRKIESTLHEVMQDSSTLTQSLVGSVRLPRKYKPVVKEISSGVPEDAFVTSENVRSTPIAVMEQNYSSPFPSSVATTASTSHNFRTSDPVSPSTDPSDHHGPSSSSGPSGSHEPSGSSGPSEPSSSTVGSTTSSKDPPSNPEPTATVSSGMSLSRRLRLSLFSSSK